MSDIALDRMNGPLDKSRVLIVDDHPIVRQGLIQLIDQTNDLCGCGEAGDAPQALELVVSLKPDIVIIDISLSRGPDGMELLKTIRKDHPSLPVLILSMHDESCYAERVLRSGANGYIMKAEAPQTLLIAIRQILGGEIYVSETMSRRILHKFAGGASTERSSPIDSLTDRELQVFRLVGRGQGTRQIAEDLQLSIKTIESHYAHIKDKLSLRNSRQLVQTAIEWAGLQGSGRHDAAG